LVTAVKQIKIGIEEENITFNIIRKLQLVCLTWRHEENAGRLNFVFVSVNHMKTRSSVQVQNFKEIVSMWILYTEMAFGIEHFYLKLLAFSLGLAEIVQAVYRKLFAMLPHKKVLSYCCESTNN
jgi:hypothetical protein